MEHRTLEEYKKDVFNKLTEEKKLKGMYEMSKQLCEIDNYIHSQEFFENFENNENANNVIRKIHSILGIYLKEWK